MQGGNIETLVRKGATSKPSETLRMFRKFLRTIFNMRVQHYLRIASHPPVQTPRPCGSVSVPPFQDSCPCRAVHPETKILNTNAGRGAVKAARRACSCRRCVNSRTFLREPFPPGRVRVSLPFVKKKLLSTQNSLAGTVVPLTLHIDQK